jgi:hypothetical protein
MLNMKKHVQWVLTYGKDMALRHSNIMTNIWLSRAMENVPNAASLHCSELWARGILNFAQRNVPPSILPPIPCAMTIK